MSITYAAVKKDTGELIGSISLMINKIHKKTEFEYWIGASYWNNGYCTEASQAIIEFEFKNFDLNRIFALSFEGNAGSWRVMEKAGMEYEGTRRQDVVKNRVSVDLKSYSIIRDEFYISKIN